MFGSAFINAAPRSSIFLYALAALVRLLPEAVARELGQTAGYFASFVLSKRMQMAERHMRRALGRMTDVSGAAREVFSSYGRYWAELLWLRPDRITAISAHLTVEGIEHIVAAQHRGRGMILALPHVGNWDIGICVLRNRGIPVTVVAEALAASCVGDWSMKLRRMLGMEVLLMGSTQALALGLARRLKSGHVVALMSDRDIRGNGIEVEFFGEATTLPAGPALLADLTGAPILPAAVYFQSGRGHRAVVGPAVEGVSGGNREERLQLLTQRLAHALEGLVREAPTQWHLLQPNWPSDWQVS